MKIPHENVGQTVEYETDDYQSDIRAGRKPLEIGFALKNGERLRLKMGLATYHYLSQYILDDIAERPVPGQRG